VFLFVISGFLLFGLMSFLAESLSNPVFLKVGGIAPLGAILMGKGAKKQGGDRGRNNTNGDENARSLIDRVIFSSLLL